MNNILFCADYSMGLGDFIVKLYAICHLNKYIKENYDVKTIFIIEEYYTQIIDKLLNISFFTNFFDIFYIQNKSNQYLEFINYNNVMYDNIVYNRKYSAINNLNNNSKGYWDVYNNLNLNIPYHLFDYRDPTTRKSEPIPDYGLTIFNPNIFIEANSFIDKNLYNSFDCIYYRSLGSLDDNHLYDSIIKIKNTNINKQIFLTSNSELAKSRIYNDIDGCVTYKPINLSVIDGYGTSIGDSDRIIDLAIEMIIMAYASAIHYAGNHHYISLFNYYAHMIKRVPLINYG